MADNSALLWCWTSIKPPNHPGIALLLCALNFPFFTAWWKISLKDKVCEVQRNGLRSEPIQLFTSISKSIRANTCQYARILKHRRNCCRSPGVCDRVQNTLTKLTPLIRNEDIPPAQVKAQVSSLQIALVSLQRLIPEIPKAQPERNVAIHLNYLILALTQSVTTLCDLEFVIDFTAQGRSVGPTRPFQTSWLESTRLRLDMMQQLSFQSLVMNLVELVFIRYRWFHLCSFYNAKRLLVYFPRMQRTMSKNFGISSIILLTRIG